MFRKTPSKTDRPSIIAELRKEFGTHIERFEVVGDKLLKKYSKQFFSGMVVLMVVSCILAFSVMRQKGKASSPYSSQIKSGASTGLGTLLQTGSALKEVLELQQQINSILKQDSLSAADTLLLKQAFRRLEDINTQLTPKQ